MQLLSLGQLLGTLAVQPVWSSVQEYLQRPEVQRYGPLFLGFLAVSQVIRILAWWGSSKVVIKGKTATFSSAITLWLSLLAFTILLIVGLSAFIPIVVALHDSWRALTAWGGVALLSLIIVFWIPMKIYGVGFWRALGLLLLAGIAEWAVMFGLVFVAKPIFLTEKELASFREVEETNAAQWRSRLDQLTGKDPAAEIDRLLDVALGSPQRSLREREAAVRTLQRKLENRRRTLPSGSPAANETFRRQLSRYMHLLNEVKAERAAPSANEAHYFPAENFKSFVA